MAPAAGRLRAQGLGQRGRHHARPRRRYIGLVNRAGDTQDRVTVAISAQLHSVVRTDGGELINRDVDRDRDGQIEVCEYWTLNRDGNGWRLESIQQEHEGAHYLDTTIVTAPWSDDARLRDESLVELVDADAPPVATNVSELVSVEFDGTARQKALDLSLADPRCSPDALDVAVHRALDAWAEAVDGDDAGPLAIATPAAAQALLYARAGPHGTARVVVRGPQILRVAITAMHTDRGAPRMEVEVRVCGRRYVEDRDTVAVISGDKDNDTVFAERWTLELDDAASVPWRLVAATPSWASTSGAYARKDPSASAANRRLLRLRATPPVPDVPEPGRLLSIQLSPSPDDLLADGLRGRLPGAGH